MPTALVRLRKSGLTKRGAQQLFQHGAGDGHAFRLAGGDLAGALAQHAGDGAFQIAHTGLAGVAVDDAVERALAQGDLAGQAAGLELLGQQVLAGNVVFFHAGVAGQLDDVHAVTQGPGMLPRSLAVVIKSTWLRSNGISMK